MNQLKAPLNEAEIRRDGGLDSAAWFETISLDESQQFPDQHGAKDQPGRVERLQAWCAASEQSGIRALEEFAEFLRGYRLQTA